MAFRKCNDEQKDGTAETSARESLRDMNCCTDPKGRDANVYKKQLYNVVG